MSSLSSAISSEARGAGLSNGRAAVSLPELSAVESDAGTRSAAVDGNDADPDPDRGAGPFGLPLGLEPAEMVPVLGIRERAVDEAR